MPISIGYQTTLEIADPAAPTVFTMVGGMFDITPPATKVDSIDITNMQSPNGYKEQIPGLKSLDKLGFKLNWDPNNATEIFLQGIISLSRIFRITYPNGVRDTFNGFLMGYVPAAPIDNKMTVSAEVEISGSPTRSAAAAPVNSVLPAVSGSLTNGQTLTAYVGVWTNAPTGYTYQWKKGGVNIGGATNATYTTVAGDVGGIITVAITATNSAGSATATSSNLGAIV